MAKLAEFSEVLCNRIHDLTDQKIQNEFWIHLSCVQKLSISFARVIKNIDSYPLSKHSKVHLYLVLLVTTLNYNYKYL